MAVFALIGCAHIHTPGFIKRIKDRQAAGGDVRVKYVWDPNPARAEVRAAELGAKVSKSPSRAFNDPEVTGVIICSETNLHKKLVLAAAQAKKHLFVEKPLGLGVKDAQVMAQAVEQAGVIFQTGYFNRSNPLFCFLKEQITLGNLGRITRVRGSNCHSGALGGWFDAKPHDPANDWRWMADPKVAGCGAFGDLGTHLLDILMWLIGDVAAVTAEIKSVTGRYGDCDETGEGLIKFQNGVIGTLAGGWLDVTDPVTLLVSGTEGHAAVIQGQLYFQSSKVAGADGKQPWTAGLPQSLPHAFELFVDAVLGQTGLPLVTVREAASRSAVMEAFYQGACKSRWVVVKGV